MPVWLVLLLVAAGLVMIVICMNHIEGHMYFSRREDNDTLWINIRALFGMIQYKYQVPIIRFRGLFGGVTVHTQLTKGDPASLEMAEMRRITREKVIQFYTNSNLIKKSIHGFNEWAKDSLSHVKCTQLRWETRIGVGDAPETAVMTGFVWGVKSSLLGYAFHYVKMLTKPKVIVEPQYNKMQFSTEFSCIAKIRVGNAIIAGLLLLVRILKVKGGLRTWQSILFKA